MSPDKIKYIIRILSIVALLMVPVYLGFKLYFGSEENITEAYYVGGSQCIECHEKEYEDWKGSDHDLAMDEATEEFVRGDFSGVELERAGQVHKAYQKEDKFFVWTDGPNGEMEEFEVKYVFGHYPLQQYLVEFERGKYQTLAMTYNTMDSNWYYMADSVYNSELVDHHNWLHWSNQSQNWNGMCADCHSTNLQKKYDHSTDSYNTTWVDIDVNCEACHGPGSDHIEWANKTKYFKDESNYGLLVNTSTQDNKEYVDQCARCHSRRNSFTDYTPQSNSIYQHMNPSLPMEPMWHIDGQILEEDYVYASFTQSKMYMHDVKCNDCHNVHSGKLILENNALCNQCHQADIYDTPRHHFHKDFGEVGQALISEAGLKMEVGSGSLCINCHMHGQNYMGVDYRRDHSFRVPRPDLSIQMGVPNACNQCHTQETPQWSQNYIEDWYGKSRPFHFSEAVWAASNNEEGADEMLRNIIVDELYPNNVRALCFYYLIGTQAENLELIKESLNHLAPEIRLAAMQTYPLQTEEDIKILAHRLNDETQAIRIQAASLLSPVGKEYIPREMHAAFDTAVQEQLASIHYNLDFPSEKANMGNYYYHRKDFENAEKYYKAAIDQDSELSYLRINLAILLSQNGKLEEAASQLEEYLKVRPDDYESYYRYGLLLAEMQKYEEALEYLIIASKNLPQNSRVDYNIAMLYEFFGDLSKAEQYLDLAVQKEPNSIQNQNNLMEFRRKHNLK
jgi:tetratricopeptide (TPR) repeat protein